MKSLSTVKFDVLDGSSEVQLQRRYSLRAQALCGIVVTLVILHKTFRVLVNDEPIASVGTIDVVSVLILAIAALYLVAPAKSSNVVGAFVSSSKDIHAWSARHNSTIYWVSCKVGYGMIWTGVAVILAGIILHTISFIELFIFINDLKHIPLFSLNLNLKVFVWEVISACLMGIGAFMMATVSCILYCADILPNEYTGMYKNAVPVSIAWKITGFVSYLGIIGCFVVIAVLFYQLGQGLPA